ncbi:MAG: 50S ribosomal protein L29 [Sporocytophaga sp.]|jgi:large subunit ribosomal protein L29|uniref:Large ribosomal subunit protein uL29 n=1 Tax=Sporocytophaga myxococcoides TaxID=153721 RepID=A0A098LCT6_9BACT|nr:MULTISPECIES: 50S ribosomal protein L29 [Sporocytophaga]MBO9699635.1 50S ribosomal protein L29 [Sporocytophaga sp.]MCR6638090.1 50S ribosomal protein L29 [Sporocytophaga sp.]GAL84108.1 50S ribosomal protein L29 [Sporocytophaga myxococcoides]
MKTSDIKSLNAADLKSRISAEQEALAKLKFAHAISPIENPMKIREAKKVIARLQTALSEKVKSKS